jgi:hypothetical protein
MSGLDNFNSGDIAVLKRVDKAAHIKKVLINQHLGNCGFSNRE